MPGYYIFWQKWFGQVSLSSPSFNDCVRQARIGPVDGFSPISNSAHPRRPYSASLSTGARQPGSAGGWGRGRLAGAPANPREGGLCLQGSPPNPLSTPTAIGYLAHRSFPGAVSVTMNGKFSFNKTVFHYLGWIGFALSVLAVFVLSTL